MRTELTLLALLLLSPALVAAWVVAFAIGRGWER